MSYIKGNRIYFYEKDIVMNNIPTGPMSDVIRTHVELYVGNNRACVLVSFPRSLMGISLKGHMSRARVRNCYMQLRKELHRQYPDHTLHGLTPR